MPELYTNRKSVEGGFEPIALQNHNVVIHYLGNKPLYRKVDFYESFGPVQIIDLGVLAAGAVTARTQLPLLDMPDDEFSQVRWHVIDNAQVRLFLPTGVAKGSLKFLQTVYDMNTPLRDPNLVSTEFFVWQDNRPAVEAINGMAYGLNAVRIIVAGYRFHTVDLATVRNGSTIIGQIEKGEIPAVKIWATGRGQG